MGDSPSINVTSSKQILIAWTHISHICLLRLRQLRSPSFGGPSPILIPAGKGVDGTHHGREAAKANAERVLESILGSVPRSKGVGRDDAADIAEAHLPGGADSTSTVATKIQGKPADLNCVGKLVATAFFSFFSPNIPGYYSGYEDVN